MGRYLNVRDMEWQYDRKGSVAGKRTTISGKGRGRTGRSGTQQRPLLTSENGKYVSFKVAISLCVPEKTATNATDEGSHEIETRYSVRSCFFFFLSVAVNHLRQPWRR